MSPAPVAPAVGGRRRRMSKATRRMLRAMKMKGGLEVEEGVQGQSDADVALAGEEMGGRRRRSRRRHSRRRHRSHRYRAGLFA